MEKGQSHLQTSYGNRVRVRACGFLVSNDRILMVKHTGLGAEGFFWAPPGGGVDFGESVRDALQREFREEVGLEVRAGEMLYVNEFVEPPLHAIELFFDIEYLGGTVAVGYDPEHALNQQIIQDARFMTMEEIHALPIDTVHGVFREMTKVDDRFSLKSFR